MFKKSASIPKDLKNSTAKNSWFKDKKIIGTIILIIVVAFQLFAFLKVPFFSTIHGYTIGMLFGWYNPFFYVFSAYAAMVMIFANKIRLPRWIKLNGFTYWIVAIAIMFIGVSTGYYQTKNNWTEIGFKSWKTFNTWFSNFTQGGAFGAWTPANTNGGVVGVFLYSFFTMICSGIGSFVIAIISLVVTISFVVSGSSFAFYKNLLNKRKITLQQKEISVEKESEKVEELITSLPNSLLPEIDDPFAKEDQSTSQKPAQELENHQSSKEGKKDDFPFDDPFNV